MTAKDKLELLNGIHYGDTESLKKYVKSGIIDCDTDTGRVSCRFDLRKFIQDKLKEKGISQRQMALRIGIYPQNFNNYINGTKTLPLQSIEEILWLFEEDNTNDL